MEVELMNLMLALRWFRSLPSPQGSRRTTLWIISSFCLSSALIATSLSAAAALSCQSLFSNKYQEVQRRFAEEEVSLAIEMAQSSLDAPLPVLLSEGPGLPLSLNGLVGKRVSLLSWADSSHGETTLNVGTLIRSSEAEVSIRVKGRISSIKREDVAQVFLDGRSHFKRDSIKLGLEDGRYYYPDTKYERGFSITELAKEKGINVDLRNIDRQAKNLIGTRVLADSMAFLNRDTINPSLVLSLGVVEAATGTTLILKMGLLRNEIDLTTQNHLYIIP